MDTRFECKGKTDRTGLYILVFIAMMASCDALDVSRQARDNSRAVLEILTSTNTVVVKWVEQDD